MANRVSEAASDFKHGSRREHLKTQSIGECLGLPAAERKMVTEFYLSAQGV